MISSDTVITQDNKAGIEILRLAMDGEEGRMEASFHLEQDTRKVHIYPEKLNEWGNCITGLTIQSVALQDRDNYFLAVICMGASIFLAVFWCFCPDEKRKEYGILLPLVDWPVFRFCQHICWAVVIFGFILRGLRGFIKA